MREAIEASLRDVRAEEAKLSSAASTFHSCAVGTSLCFSSQSTDLSEPISPTWSQEGSIAPVQKGGYYVPRPFGSSSYSSRQRVSQDQFLQSFSSQSSKRVATFTPETSDDDRSSPPRRRKSNNSGNPSFSAPSSLLDGELRLPPSRSKSNAQETRLAYPRLPQRPAHRGEDATKNTSSTTRQRLQRKPVLSPAPEMDADIIEENL